ncbi:FecR family protein [Chitinophaga sp. 22321]|uniref:FecR family protein n=1 Tax=Chitinophaga hostae TaxID=2831022 RepID=A0ABS5IZ48_9BACT|nr:FecR family protein [Chitinophaga hostae]MBS0028170.1 FecR family protein [Chitinophaga hostae]
MKNVPERIAYLILRAIREESSEEERTELEDWRISRDENDVIIKEILSEGYIAGSLKELSEAKNKTSHQLADFGIHIDKIYGDNRTGKQGSSPLRVFVLRYRRELVAASVACLLVASAYWLFRVSPGRRSQQSLIAADASAGTNKAVLTLSDGSVIHLDSAGNRVILDRNASVQKQGNILSYDNNSGQATVSYNTLATPRGGQFHVQLSDGTNVWLNAASSLRYPTSFPGNNREVEITGEAYFEIAQIAGKPFKVKIAEKGDLLVLGTSFNIKAYDDETSVTTTLVSGKVKLINGISSAELHPGDRAQWRVNSNISVLNNADTDKELAWKNGFFNFNGVHLQDAMRQISRWYDIDVTYEDDVPDVEFVGEMERNINLSVLLKALEGFDIHFRLENGRHLIVMR